MKKNHSAKNKPTLLSGLSIKDVRKIFQKTNITNVRVRIRGVRNISFSENFTYVLNGSLLSKKN